MSVLGEWRDPHLDPVSGEERAWAKPGVLGLDGHAIKVLCIWQPGVEGE